MDIKLELMTFYDNIRTLFSSKTKDFTRINIIIVYENNLSIIFNNKICEGCSQKNCDLFCFMIPMYNVQ